MSGDFERMYNSTREDVLRYCLRRASRDDALDAAAEVFAIAWRRRDVIPPNPLPWLYGVARKVLGNHRRSARRRARFISRSRGMATTTGPELEIVRSEEHRAVAHAVARLGARDAEVIRLAAWEGLSRDQLATALGISPNAATQRLTRALERLAQELGAERPRGRRFFERRSA